MTLFPGVGGANKEPKTVRPVAKNRDIRLDALRGFFLISMAGMHVPSPMSDALRECFGYTSAAEGFIFLSACLAGMVYGRTYLQADWQTMSQRIWKRSRLIYFVHLGIILPAVLIAWLLAGHVIPLANHFHDFLVHPWGALMMIPLLMHQPPLFDILPLYVIGLGITPWLLAFARRRGWQPILLVSAGVWLADQLMFKNNIHLVHDPSHLLPLRWGSFDLMAWQLLWICGLALGETSFRRPGPMIAPEYRLGVATAALMVIPTCFLLRHAIIPHNWLPFEADLWVDKWTLGPLRLLNFSAWAGLLLAWNPRLSNRWLAPLGLLGRHSLSVFAVHLPLVIAAVTFIQVYTLPKPWQIVVSLTVIALLFAWAAWLEHADHRAVSAPAAPRLPSQPPSRPEEPAPAFSVRRWFSKVRANA